MVVMHKYEFSIQTRDGQKVESVVIAGRDQADAERKLFQMYRHCSVLRCEVKTGDGKHQAHAATNSVEDILSLISK